MYPINLLILEKAHLDKFNGATEKMDSVKVDPIPERIKGFPLTFMYCMNNIIITDTTAGTFYYIKNRYTGETDTHYDIKELPKHIRRIHRLSHNCLTIKDKVLNWAYTVLNKLGE